MSAPDTIADGGVLSLLQQLGFDVCLATFTENMRKRSFIDAKKDLRAILVANGIHDFEGQKLGVDNIRPISVRIFTGQTFAETQATVYRPLTGDGRHKRIWIGKLRELAVPNDTIAFFAHEGALHIVNVTGKPSQGQLAALTASLAHQSGEGGTTAQPDEDRPYVAAVEEIAEAEQGFAVGAAVRKAVEERAMSAATDYCIAAGYAVQSVAADHPYDLVCTKGDHVLWVEVKGTQGRGEAVFLTRNEVETAMANAERMVLFVLSGIEVVGNGETLTASGGTSRILQPWDVQQGELAPVTFRYRLP